MECFVLRRFRLPLRGLVTCLRVLSSGGWRSSGRWTSSLSRCVHSEGRARVPCVMRSGPVSSSSRSKKDGVGEVAHVRLTDDRGGVRRHKVTDPSFHNWAALEMALPGNQISDFPLCNKSFNLSYAGHDL